MSTPGSERGLNLRILRETMRCELGENLLAIQEDLEAAVVERLQLQRFHLLLELFQNLLRQTDGVGFVLSGGAILNLDLHRWSCLPRFQRGGSAGYGTVSPRTPPWYSCTSTTLSASKVTKTTFMGGAS